MKTLKHYLRHIALLLVFTLLLPTAAPALNVVAAETTSYTVDLGDNAYVLIVETDSSRTSECYVNGEMIQRAVYEFDTGEILYYDLSQNTNGRSAWASGRNLRPTETYHIDDFKVTSQKEETMETTQVFKARASQLTPNVTIEQAPGSGGDSSWEFVRERKYNDDGKLYIWYLYGRTGVDEHPNNVVKFFVGTAISIIFAAIMPSWHWFLQLALDKVGTSVTMTIVDNLFLCDEIRDSYWEYKFYQKSPVLMEFICQPNFVYKREKKYNIEYGHYKQEGEYEVTLEETEIEIKRYRDAIMAEPGHYW